LGAPGRDLDPRGEPGRGLGPGSPRAAGPLGGVSGEALGGLEGDPRPGPLDLHFWGFSGSCRKRPQKRRSLKRGAVGSPRSRKAEKTGNFHGEAKTAPKSYFRVKKRALFDVKYQNPIWAKTARNLGEFSGRWIAVQLP